MEQQNDYVENKEVVFTGVTVTLVGNTEDIQRVRFVGQDHDVTYKPKVQKEVFEEGIKVEKTVPMTKDQLPQLIKDIAKKCSIDGKATVKVSYNIFNTQNAEGDDVMYRYINSVKTLDKWTLL